jgi:hypothetical protein
MEGCGLLSSVKIQRLLSQEPTEEPMKTTNIIDWEKVKTAADIDKAVTELIPVGQGDAKFWTVAGQAVLSEVMSRLIRDGKRSDEHLKTVLTRPVREITQFAPATQEYLGLGEKQAAGVMAVIMSNLNLR